MLPDDDKVDDDEVDDDEEIPVDPIVVPIEEAFDLHTFAPRDVGDAVRAYLEAAVEAGFREVRVIHGRGKGIQRDRVHRLLARHPLVLEFTDAPPGRGGWGATLVRLRTQSPDSLE